MLWRVGTHRPRNIYLQLRDEPQTTDPAVAVTLGTDEEAEHTARMIVDAMNTQRRHGPGWDHPE